MATRSKSDSLLASIAAVRDARFQKAFLGGRTARVEWKEDEETQLELIFVREKVLAHGVKPDLGRWVRIRASTIACYQKQEFWS